MGGSLKFGKILYLCSITAKIGCARHNAQAALGDSALAGTIFAKKSKEMKQLVKRIRRWLASLSFRTGAIVTLCCIPFYIASFAQAALPTSATTKAVMWTVLFGLAKTFQYAGLTILGVEGVKRLKKLFSLNKNPK